MTDVSLRLQQWLFVQATSEAAARALVRREFIDQYGCDWADQVEFDTTRTVISGKDARAFAKVVLDVKNTQLVHLARLWETVRPVDWDHQVTMFDPYKPAPNQGMLPAILGLVAQLLAGQWGPYSGGWDVVGVTADLSDVKRRMKVAPLTQFAVPVVLTY